MNGLADQYRQDKFVWYLFESCCAPRVNGAVVIRKRRPHPVILVAAISSFIVSRNVYASGDLALPLGIWHFACKSHVDVKRVYCRLGFIVSDSTARNALNSMSAASLAALQESVRDATERGEVEWGKIIDNVQQYSPRNCKPGAWNAKDHIERVIKQDRQKMTTQTVYESIDWSHNNSVSELHFVCVLADFIPHLNSLSPEISAIFRVEPIAKHRVRGDEQVELQPLATNSEREVENQGMMRGLGDFDQQMGIDPEKSKNLLSWVQGDGASHATLMRLQKYLAVTLDVYKSFRNVLSTPETWHTKSTGLNTNALNHYAPAASKDPLSLSRSSNAANMKRPTDLKKCDFYPTSRSMTMIWEARVLDSAYEQSLSAEDYNVADPASKAPKGSPWGRACAPPEPQPGDTDSEPDMAGVHDSPDGSEHDSDSESHDVDKGSQHNAEADLPGLMDISDDISPADNVEPADSDRGTPSLEIPPPPKPKFADDDGSKVHTELPGFDGDRVVSNAILFLMEFGWWIELNYAVPEGDIGRVLEILKIYIFVFAGSSNQNYMGYMLDLYALLGFECSPDLKEALLNNWWMNLRGEIGTCIETDLMQEHYNRWLEDMHFLKIKEDIESAFELKRRSKSHTSPHLRDETKVLLRMYKEEELHLFRPGRSMGHAAINWFDRGFQRLDDGKMKEYLDCSKLYADIIRDMEEIRQRPAGASDAADAMDFDLLSPVSVSHPPQSRPASSNEEFNRPPSVNSVRSTCSSASRAAADSAEEWDPVDHSDERLVSGSDLAFTVDSVTGRMNTDWYEEDEFESVLERLCSPEPEVDSESDDEIVDTEVESEGEDNSEAEE
ncbi:hypothetical protein DFH09DRAFT_1438577 [Mycena vulgaris]|nr:hypothetical protein DFH09DRAFT_1438577 [Mycena vulgaris]